MFAVPVNVKMNNYQNKAREEILDFVTVRCKDCKRIMNQFRSSHGFIGFYCLYCDRDLVLTEV